MQTTIKQSAQQNKYHITNQNYQNYQNSFYFGLDFRIFSKSAKQIKIPYNYNFLFIII
ncbi:hypothetical protein [Helicobacter didelphidarum]|uniref:hypothetical protein n=1 Tax=Helicobacter didelphidarum TaxID=2040648 RepID=UPI0015F16F78|nr:hypothetical protein [Helicobacter didelphidarum]